MLFSLEIFLNLLPHLQSNIFSAAEQLGNFKMTTSQITTDYMTCNQEHSNITVSQLSCFPP